MFVVIFTWHRWKRISCPYYEPKWRCWWLLGRRTRGSPAWQPECKWRSTRARSACTAAGKTQSGLRQGSPNRSNHIHKTMSNRPMKKTKKNKGKYFLIKCEPIMLSDGNEIVMFFVFVFVFYVKTRRKKRKLKENTFWSPNRICLRALRETFMRQRKMRASSAGVTTAWGPAMFALLPAPLPGGRPSSFWTFWWSCLSIISYTLSPWISKSSCENKK